MKHYSKIVSGQFYRPLDDTRPLVLVHGGAWDIPKSEWEAHYAGMQLALQAAVEKAQSGGHALDMVEGAITSMEANGAFDAGCGSVLNAAGFVELDAGIMDGTEAAFGAVAGVKRFQHPIQIARRIIEEGDRAFCFLAGEGAEHFATSSGFESVEPATLISQRERARFEGLKQASRYHTSHPFLSNKDAHPKGTVGCVAVDATGSLAAGTSTGGTPFRPAGRIGDSPLPGCGYYASNQAAASATGWGEAIASVVLCKTAVDAVEQGRSVQEAAERALDIMQHRIVNEEQVGATGGLILLTAEGQGAWAYSTPVMARAAWCEASGFYIADMTSEAYK